MRGIESHELTSDDALAKFLWRCRAEDLEVSCGCTERPDEPLLTLHTRVVRNQIFFVRNHARAHAENCPIARAVGEVRYDPKIFLPEPPNPHPPWVRRLAICSDENTPPHFTFSGWAYHVLADAQRSAFIRCNINWKISRTARTPSAAELVWAWAERLIQPDFPGDQPAMAVVRSQGRLLRCGLLWESWQEARVVNGMRMLRFHFLNSRETFHQVALLVPDEVLRAGVGHTYSHPAYLPPPYFAVVVFRPSGTVEKIWLHAAYSDGHVLIPTESPLETAALHAAVGKGAAVLKPMLDTDVWIVVPELDLGPRESALALFRADLTIIQVSPGLHRVWLVEVLRGAVPEEAGGPTTRDRYVRLIQKKRRVGCQLFRTAVTIKTPDF